MKLIWNAAQESSLLLLQRKYHPPLKKQAKKGSKSSSTAVPATQHYSATEIMLQLKEWAWPNARMRKHSSNPLLPLGRGGGFPTGNTPSAQEHCNVAKQPGCASPWLHYAISESKHEHMSCYLLSYKENELSLTIGPTIRVSIHFLMLSLQKLRCLLRQATPLRQRCWLGQRWPTQGDPHHVHTIRCLFQLLIYPPSS